MHEEAQRQEDVLRLSMDAKAPVKVGPFSRGGRSRVMIRASDHDFAPQETLTPWGILLPQHDEFFMYFAVSKVTSDCIVDRLEDFWQENRGRFPMIRTLLINLDNGPENHSRRTQFMKRIVQFGHQYQLDIRLAYYPPYHSKYNPIERGWGVLENYWNGALLDTREAVLQFAQNMTWKGKHPVVRLTTQLYQTGIRLTQDEMKAVEAQIHRLPGLGKWFVDIPRLSG